MQGTWALPIIAVLGCVISALAMLNLGNELRCRKMHIPTSIVHHHHGEKKPGDSIRVSNKGQYYCPDCGEEYDGDLHVCSKVITEVPGTVTFEDSSLRRMDLRGLK